jgi:hypothetical protein
MHQPHRGVDATTIGIPTQWIRTGYGIPTVCARHGRPHVRRPGLVVESAPAGWTYALLLAGVLPFLLARALTRWTTVARAWPFCDRCERRRRSAFLAAGLVMAAGLVLIGLAFADPTGSSPLLVLGGVVLVAGYAALHWARRQVIARVRLSRGGERVLVRAPAPEFDAQVRAALTPPGSPAAVPPVPGRPREI